MIKVFRNIILVVVIIFLKIYHCDAQIKFNFNESYYYELPYDTSVLINGSEFIYIGGFSGIDKSIKKDRYFIVSDAHSGNHNKGDARIYEIKIVMKNDSSPTFTNTKKLKNSSIWSESVRCSRYGDMFISDERTINGKECSQIFKVGESGEFLEIQLPDKFQNEMYDNSGFEGIALSPDESKLFVSLERPMPKSKNRNFTNILEYKTDKPQSDPKEYYYPMQRKASGNGVTEILFYNDSILFVMERDYVKPDNFVSIYSVNLKQLKNNQSNFKGLPKKAILMDPKLLFTFNDVNNIGNKKYKVNNIEGFTFSTCGQYLIFISDNNFGNKSKHTPTQILCMKIDKISIP